MPPKPLRPRYEGKHVLTHYKRALSKHETPEAAAREFDKLKSRLDDAWDEKFRRSPAFYSIKLKTFSDPRLQLPGFWRNAKAQRDLLKAYNNVLAAKAKNNPAFAAQFAQERPRIQKRLLALNARIKIGERKIGERARKKL